MTYKTECTQLELTMELLSGAEFIVTPITVGIDMNSAPDIQGSLRN